MTIWKDLRVRGFNKSQYFSISPAIINIKDVYLSLIPSVIGFLVVVLKTHSSLFFQGMHVLHNVDRFQSVNGLILEKQVDATLPGI